MNATTNHAATIPAIEVLCRFDPAKNKPVVFVASNIVGGEIESWINGDAVMSPLSYYHSTLPLSAADEDILAKRYARHFAAKHVLIRHRLPRTSRVVPNRITHKTTTAPEGVVSVVAQLTPVADAVQPAPVVEVVTPTTAKPTVTRKAGRRKAAAKKSGQRKPAAKPIEAQPAPAPVAGVEVETPPTLEQKVDQLASLFAKLLDQVAAHATK